MKQLMLLWKSAKLYPSIVAVLMVAAGLAAAPNVSAESSSKPAVTVFKSPYCGCCSNWVEHLRRQGFDVVTRDMENLDAIKMTAGVPRDLHSCHTATVDGYVVEGHVPVEAIQRLLEERPKVQGLAVPGMPIGSPGMEGPEPESYSVFGFSGNGERAVFMSVPAQ